MTPTAIPTHVERWFRQHPADFEDWLRTHDASTLSELWERLTEDSRDFLTAATK